ncbi:BolA/IbaG family iron-sulfur metabolism protein [Agarilytica rhodophyticola]|uniref:BolA/IbaG family iron-sulfur metabolism protein n=1 Tax=Agarilytica rhodophyticola TaxID=1737490 RepID=UPI001C1FC9CA|nr:BolA/IbaG family iron-sulfur metabolism protein [Agarilytica rhodophyticola]
MSEMRDRIEQKLQQQLKPTYISVVDESHGHNVPQNAQTHFKVVMVSSSFDELRAVKRHQNVYSILQEELSGSVHALALHLYSVKEWSEHGNVPDSPACLGGSKSNS